MSKTKKPTTRLKKITGTYSQDAFNKVLDQFHGRAVVFVVILNVHCQQCVEILNIISHLEKGAINKLEKLVLIYGFNNTPLEGENSQKSTADTEKKLEEENKKVKGSAFFSWSAIPEGHGYAIYLNKDEVTYYKGEFDHSEFKENMMQSLRRFSSSVFTLADLTAKKNFIEKKRTGMIVETKSSTKQSVIVSLEESIKVYAAKMKIPVYFLKGLKEEISFVKDGEVLNKQPNLDISKFMKKAVKSLTF